MGSNMGKTAPIFVANNAFMRRLPTWLLSALFLSCCLSVSAAEGSAQLVVPVDDLPSAVTGGYRVDFTRNGAFVVSKEGHYLFDGGLAYASPDWKEWGTQIRRSDAADSWQPDPTQKTTKLLIRGTLFDFNRNPRFTFVESAEVIAGGLRFSYSITPLAKRDIGAFGVALHFPVAETAKADAVFSPGLGNAAMPEKLDKATLYTGTARTATVFVADEPRVMVAGLGSLGWRLLDYRTWNVNAYWLIGTDYALKQPLSRGETASFSFDVWLGDTAAHRVALGPGRCEVNPYGGIALAAAGARILEGGLAREGEQLKWLHATARAEPPGADADARATGQCDAAGSSNVPVSYEAKLTPAADNAVVVAYKMRTAGAVDGEYRAKLALVIPISGPPSLASEQSPAGEEDPAGPGDSKVPPGQRILDVTCQGGHVLTVEAQDPLSVSQAQVNGTECYLVNVPIRKAEGAGATVWVRLRLAQKPASASGGAGK